MVSRDLINPLRCVLIPHGYIEITITSALLHFPSVFGLSTSSTPEQECVAVCLFVINTRHQLLAGSETPYKWHFMENIHETA